MSNDLYIKQADLISDKLIELWKNNETKNKKILELYKELLDDKYIDIQYNILSYIPERLSLKGYEIVNSEFFELKKY